MKTILAHDIVLENGTFGYTTQQKEFETSYEINEK